MSKIFNQRSVIVDAQKPDAQNLIQIQFYFNTEFSVQIEIKVNLSINQIVQMERRKKITNYTLWMDTKLGEGAFGKVYLAQQDGTKKKVAIKVLEREKINKDQYFKNALFSEIDILKCLKSNNVVQFLDVMESNNYYYIIQQYCNGGELRKYMDKVGRIPERQAIALLKQICNGFMELVKEGIMHRDLKPQNILIHDGVLKLSDFGFSKKGYDKAFNKTVVGTPLYMPLQILMASPYTSKCDIWSLGCVFYQMLHGKTPWVCSTEYELIMSIQNKQINFSPQISQVTRSFIRKCLAPDEKDRFSWGQLFNHAIFQGKFSQCNQVQNKFKGLMNHLRYMIKTKNIDLERYFANMGFTRKCFMKFSNFKNFVTYIDDHLKQDEIQEIYDRIVTKTNIGISYDELQKSFVKFGIPMSMLKVGNKPLSESPQKRKVQEAKTNFGILNKQTSLKLSNALYRLIETLENKRMTIYDVFNTYNWTEKGYINHNDLGKLLRAVDPSFSDEQVQTSFGLIDVKNRGMIPLDSFVQFFFTVTCSNGLKKQDSTNSSASMNSLAYPVQYTNTEALLSLVSDQMQRIALNPQIMNFNYNYNIKTGNNGSYQTQNKKANYKGGNGWF